MRKPVFSVMLILLLLAGLVVATGAAGDETEVVITPWKNGETYHIYPGEVAVIRAGWGACTAGLVRVYINASNYALTLDDASILTPDQVDELWGPIEPMEPLPGNEEVCKSKAGPYRAAWRYVLDGLDPGEYELHTLIWIDHPLVDGGDYDGDGKPDLFRPEDLYRDTLNTIIVHEE